MLSWIYCKHSKHSSEIYWGTLQKAQITQFYGGFIEYQHINLVHFLYSPMWILLSQALAVTWIKLINILPFCLQLPLFAQFSFCVPSLNQSEVNWPKLVLHLRNSRLELLFDARPSGWDACHWKFQSWIWNRHLCKYFTLPTLDTCKISLLFFF